MLHLGRQWLAARAIAVAIIYFYHALPTVAQDCIHPNATSTSAKTRLEDAGMRFSIQEGTAYYTAMPGGPPEGPKKLGPSPGLENPKGYSRPTSYVIYFKLNVRKLD